MTIARFKDLCIDAGDPVRLGTFWATVLDRTAEPLDDGDVKISGPTEGHRIWINRVPEVKTVKNRVHFDIYAASVAELEALGARVLWTEEHWTTMADPEGNEFCAFLRDEVPAERLHGLVVDSADPWGPAEWWARVFGMEVTRTKYGPTLENVPGMPIDTMDFATVPEPKTVKNRVHWDVVGDTEALVAAGATVLRRRDEKIRWDVLADPAGNEFCVFAD